MCIYMYIFVQIKVHLMHQNTSKISFQEMKEIESEVITNELHLVSLKFNP